MCANCNCGGCKNHGCSWSQISKYLLIVGGLNWGLVGIGMLMNSDWNVINMLLNSIPMVQAIVYILVGVAAVLSIFGCRCKTCMNGTCSSGHSTPKMEGGM